MMWYFICRANYHTLRENNMFIPRAWFMCTFCMFLVFLDFFPANTCEYRAIFGIVWNIETTLPKSHFHHRHRHTYVEGKSPFLDKPRYHFALYCLGIKPWNPLYPHHARFYTTSFKGQYPWNKRYVSFIHSSNKIQQVSQMVSSFHQFFFSWRISPP